MKRYKFIILLIMTFFLSSLEAAKAQIDSQLVGSWGENGETVYLFKSDGTGKMEGDSFRWRSEGHTLIISWDEEENFFYQIRDNHLILNDGISNLTFQRIAKEKSEKNHTTQQAESKIKKPSPQKGIDSQDSLSQLLLSSPWCSFSYSEISGATNTKRVQFFKTGEWAEKSNYEGYSSGYGGTMSSQHDSGNGGRWKVEGGQLYISNSESGFSPINLQVKRNSNGYPILTADGVEYAQCQ